MTDTILVVDDEPLLLIDLSEQLSAAGYAVIEAANGEAAKAILQRSSRGEGGKHVDLVVTDVRMPGSPDGIGLARWVGTELEIPVILLSGEVTGRDMPNIADARVTKPVNITRLIETIAQLIDARRVPGRSTA